MKKNVFNVMCTVSESGEQIGWGWVCTDGRQSTEVFDSLEDIHWNIMEQELTKGDIEIRIWSMRKP